MGPAALCRSAPQLLHFVAVISSPVSLSCSDHASIFKNLFYLSFLGLQEAVKISGCAEPALVIKPRGGGTRQ